MIDDVNRDTYETARKQAIIEAKEVYSQLEKGEFNYKSYKLKVKSIMSKYISRLNKNDILSYIGYVDIDNKRYYIQTFFGDFHFNHIIDIDLVDFKYENIKNISDILKADWIEQRYVKQIHNGNIENFSI